MVRGLVGKVQGGVEGFGTRDWEERERKRGGRRRRLWGPAGVGVGAGGGRLVRWRFL